MKVSCPNCKKTLQAPDEWAGKQVQCPKCKQPIALPASPADPCEDDLGFDLGSLGAIESAGEAVVFENRGKPMTMKEAQAAAIAAAPPEKKSTRPDPTIRICPRCKQRVKCKDIYIDVICRHCNNAIPGQQIEMIEKVKYTSSQEELTKNVDSFYTGFTGALLYPIRGIASILMGMGIGLAAIAVPLGGILAFSAAAGLNEAAEKSDFSWVGTFLTMMFIIEGIYLGAVAYCILIDTIRTTTAGNEQPPNLTWNVINLGAALGGYAALIGLYAIFILLLLAISGQGFPTKGEDFAALGWTGNIIILALLTFAVPMNIIGLASSQALDGLNPVLVFKSVGRVLGHYIFLFLIVLLCLGFYIGIMYAVMSWAGPVILEVAQKGLDVGLLKMFGGILAWSGLIGAGFYFAYSIGRLLGLFTRTYKEGIEFDL